MVMKFRFFLFLFGIFWELSVVSKPCALSFLSEEVNEVAKGQVEGEKGDRFEWNFCDGIDLPGSDCNRAFVCRTLNNGTQKSFGTKTQLKEASDSFSLTLKGLDEGCEGMEQKLQVRFYCDDSIPPTITEFSQCHSLLQLQAPEYCVEKKKEDDKLKILKERVKGHSLCESKYLKKFGELMVNLDNGETYIVNLCEEISGCHGALVCQVLPDGRTISLGAAPLIELGPNQYQILNGTMGCKGVLRSTKLEFPPNCQSNSAMILRVEETKKCEYKLIIGDQSCHLKEKKCNVELVRKGGPNVQCMKHNYGCTSEGMWVTGSCYGKFLCNGKNVVCSSRRKTCPC